MALGTNGVLMNDAIAGADNPVAMAQARAAEPATDGAMGKALCPIERVAETIMLRRIFRPIFLAA